MANTNVIQFAPALQRRRERQGDQAAYASHDGSWHGRYRDGIDGLWTGAHAWKEPAEVVQLVRPTSRLARS